MGAIFLSLWVLLQLRVPSGFTLGSLLPLGAIFTLRW